MAKKDGDYDGMNEHKQQQKIKARIRNNKAFVKYFYDKDIDVIKEVNEIREFTYNSEIYYFAITTGTIRLKGTKSWQKFKEFNI